MQLRSLLTGTTFAYGPSLVAALKAGTRIVDLGDPFESKQMVGTYAIRLRMARDPKIRGHEVGPDDEVVRDLAELVENLRAAPPDSFVRVFSIGPTLEGYRYQLFEDAETGEFMGCTRGNPHEA